MHNLIMVLDVESNGLHGEGFAYASIVKDTQTGEILAEYFNNAPIIGEVDPWVKENVLPVLPDPNVEDVLMLRRLFWEQWRHWSQKGASLWVDCGWPVESNFLSACVRDDFNRAWDGPYPLNEISTVFRLRGLDPLTTQDRLPDELPAHHPLADCKHSARLLLENW